ncbi:hypothetical protein [Flagellimonas sp.]|uniref:hypothetical protein n=1 Tax=Flagellimonas sp. TaxID=2058762 RepID=UPI003B51DEFA
MRPHRIWLLFHSAVTLLLFSCYGEDGAVGPAGEQGENGYHCWDLNLNGINDLDEDVNQDDEWNGLDCLGQDGLNGVNGINCWDLDGDWFNDEDEDVNSDGQWNALDCQGEDGNANVQRITLAFDNAYFNEYTALFIAPELNQKTLQSHIMLFTLEHIQNVNLSTFLAIPGGLAEIDRKYDVFWFTNGYVYIVVSNFDGTDTNPGWTDTWDFLHITFIKISALKDEDELSTIKKSLSEFGINIQDFDALVPYFDDE